MTNKLILSEITFNLQRTAILGNTILSSIKVGDRFVCSAIENLSKAIKAGKYKMTFYLSPQHKLVFLLHGVKGRYFIEIHKANYYYELRGCIAPCLSHQGAMGVNSGKALSKLFEEAKNHDTMYIVVKDIENIIFVNSPSIV